jgi:hypothetical protein
VSTKILVNSHPGRRICHARGLRQGDPLSLLLFVIAMEALNAIFHQADADGLFTSLHASTIRYSLSLYADDLVFFVAPCAADFIMVKAIMNTFAQTSGLHTNVSKCQITHIRCTEDQVTMVMQWFPAQLVRFPCKYLGVPLLVYALKKCDLMPLVDAGADCLPSWKAKLMNKFGRTLLTKVTLSDMRVQISIAVEVVPWIIHAIDKLRRSFIWIGTDVTS